MCVRTARLARMSISFLDPHDPSHLASGMHISLPEILVECATCDRVYLSRYRMSTTEAPAGQLCPSCGAMANLEAMVQSGLLWRAA